MTAVDGTVDEYQLPIAMFDNKDDNRPDQHVLDWPKFVRGMCQHRERSNKDGPAFSPVTYLPGTTRGKANVDKVYALVLDVDHHGEPPWDLLARWEYVGHTTFQHTPEAPRWRVVAPLSRPVSGADWPAFWLKANAYFGACVDPQTKDSSRIFYFPSCPPGAEHLVRTNHGAALDPDELPEVPVYEPPKRERSTTSPNQAYLAGWARRFGVAKAEELARMPSESGRNAACNRAAYTLAGLAADPIHDLTEQWILDALVDACHSNGLIADDGERSVLATINSGLEDGRLRPWSPADQDPLLPTRPYERRYSAPADSFRASELRLHAVRMSDVQEEAIQWLWRGWLARGKLSLLMGPPGLGKSLITHWLSARVSTGGEWPDSGECEQAAAIVFTIEDSLGDTVKPRLIAAGAHMDRVIAVRGVVNPKASLDERMFTLEEHLSLLEDIVTEEGASLVVMDPISAYLGPNVNAHREADVRRILGPLSLVAERTGAAVLNVIHLNKAKDRDALDRATGSVAFPAVSRIVMGVVADPLDEDNRRRLLLPLKCNIAQKPLGIGYRIERAPGALLPRVSEDDLPPILIWDDGGVIDDAAQALDRGSLMERNATEECVAALIQIFDANDGERMLATMGLRQLKDAGVSTSGSVLTNAKKQLGIRSIMDRSTRAWYWHPPRVMSPRAGAPPRANDPTECANVPPHSPSSITSPSVQSVDSVRATRGRAREGSEREIKLCPRCKQHMDAEVYPTHLPCTDMTGLPEGLCPIHRKLFELHECDAL